MKQRRSALGRERRRGRRSEAAAHTKAVLQRSISQSESHMWNEYMPNLRWGDDWRAAKFANPRAGATVDALTNRWGKQANTMAKKEKMLRAEFFPGNDGDQYSELPPAGKHQQRP